MEMAATEEPLACTPRKNNKHCPQKLVCLCVSWLLIPLGFLDLCAYLDLCVIDQAHDSEIATSTNFWGQCLLFLRGVHANGSSVAAISMS
jgi:hypothetical protein